MNLRIKQGLGMAAFFVGMLAARVAWADGGAAENTTLAPAGGNATAAASASGGNTTGATPSSASATGGNATTAAPPTFWTQSYLTGNWGGWRDKLGSDGFTPFMSSTGEIWGNANGGIRTGMTQDMLLTAGFGVDLKQVAEAEEWAGREGWTGYSVNATFYWEQGRTPDTNVGAFSTPSSIDNPNMARAFTVYLAKQWLGGRLQARVGELTADDTFFQTPYAALFLNSAFTAPPTLYAPVLANGDFAMPQYPVASPGVWGHFQTEDQCWDFYSAVYDGDAGPNVSHYHGLGVRTGNGALVIGEADRHYSLNGWNGTVRAGGYYHSGHFTNWQTGQAQRGVEGAYVMVDQALWQTKGADGSVQPVLNGYAFAGWAGPADRATAQTTFSAGVNWIGPLAIAPNDTAGVAVIYTGFSPDYTSSAFNPVPLGAMTAAETAVEGAYQANITPWLSVEPDVQVIFNPANAVTRSTATVVGARAVVTF